MTTLSPTIRGAHLKEILAEAHDYVLKIGTLRQTSRGRTYSGGTITLVWDQPAESEENIWSWSQAEADFYQQIFVDGCPENAPEHLAEKGQWLFPYTYAARSRFWDGGWGYVLAVIAATRAYEQAYGQPVSAITQTESVFQQYLAVVGEQVHLQPLLAVWDWLGRGQLADLIQQPEGALAFLRRSRMDQLARIIADIQQNPGSRRAVTASFVYPEIDQRLAPVQSIPPYQFFQLLPGAADRPLHSFHVHRSLDAGQGVQLDFMHDYHWLKTASEGVGRPMGTITVTAADFHVYLPAQEAPSITDIAAWLCGVTDGYRAGDGRPAALLQNAFYRQNVQRIFQNLGAES